MKKPLETTQPLVVLKLDRGDGKNHPIKSSEIQQVCMDYPGRAFFIRTGLYPNRKKRRNMVSMLAPEPMNMRKLTDGRKTFRTFVNGILLPNKMIKHAASVVYKKLNQAGRMLRALSGRASAASKLSTGF